MRPHNASNRIIHVATFCVAGIAGAIDTATLPSANQLGDNVGREWIAIVDMKRFD